MKETSSPQILLNNSLFYFLQQRQIALRHTATFGCRIQRREEY